MNILKIALAGLTLLCAGCIMVPSPYSSQLNPVADLYRSTKHGTPRVELEARLGKPSREEKDGPGVWETRFDELNYAMLKVWFDDQDNARKVEVTRAHGKSIPGYQASAVSTRVK